MHQKTSSSLEILKLVIDQAIQFLKKDHFERSELRSWYIIAKDIIPLLEDNKVHLYILKDCLENLATLILLRITTKLSHIKIFEIYESGKTILKYLRDCGLSHFLQDGIIEFLLTPPEWFTISQDQDKELLNYQLKTLEESLLRANNNTPEQCGKTKSPENIKLEIEEKQSLKEILEKSSLNDSPFSKNLELLDKACAFSLLDLKGNFVLVDKMSESLFEKSQENLLEHNIFELMIPFSASYLNKKFGESIFNMQNHSEKTFSYTIYSKNAFRKFKKTMLATERNKELGIIKGPTEKTIQESEKELFNEENSVYYKYLQALTSRATLIELKLSNLEECLMLEKSHEIKINKNHKLFNLPQENTGIENSGIVVVLVTRKAYHIQKFKYSLMKDTDKTIQEMEKKSCEKIEQIKKRLPKNLILS